MAAVTLDIQGGEKLQRRLAEISNQLSRGKGVRVGFLEKATYPVTKKHKGRLHVATVAFWNEFGTIRSPVRPFFRTAIAKGSPQWGEQMAKIARATDYNGKRTLGLMGELIKDQVQQSINTWKSPPNAPSTIKRKGFNAPLRDTMVMLRSVDYEVIT